MGISYTTNLAGIDWQALKSELAADQFDNGRTPAQLEESFRNSHACIFALSDARIIGTARVLSDGVCNAYLLDVWTQSFFRRQGIATHMVTTLLAPLRGQHVYLQTDDRTDFYRRLGFGEQPVGMSKVIGNWLEAGA